MHSLDEYLEMYGRFYPTQAIEDIKKDFNSYKQYDILLQIKSKLNLLKEEQDIYQGFIKHLKNKNILNGKVLEIGAGYYPILSERLAKENVDISAIDPNLVTTNIPKLKLIKNEFPNGINVNEFDSLIAVMPCQATIPIIEKANQHHQEFSIVLCMCTHFDNPCMHFPITYEKWEDYVIKCAKENLENNANLEMSYFDSTYKVPYKILTKKFIK